MPPTNPPPPPGAAGGGGPRSAVLIRAARRVPRLKSKNPKVLHEVGGKPLLLHVMDAALRVVPAGDVYVIVGHEADRVRAAVGSSGVNFVQQREQRGTGHAVMSAKDAVENYDHVLVLSGDAPLISSTALERLRDHHLQHRAAMTILSAVLDQP